MPARRNSILLGIAHSRALRHMRGLVDRAGSQDVTAVRPLRQQARELLREAERAHSIADARLALPLLGSNVLDAPVQADWAWRPDLWREPLPRPGVAGPANKTSLGDNAEIFHDCPLQEMTFRQRRNEQDDDLAPFGVVLDVLGFAGSFLSLAVTLPPEAVEGLKKRHIIRMAARFDYEIPIEMYARLNIRHGPNTEQIVRSVAYGEAQTVVEWDLAFADINERRIESAWVDLIFETPAMNKITVRDVVVSRRPRAEI